MPTGIKKTPPKRNPIKEYPTSEPAVLKKATGRKAVKLDAARKAVKIKKEETPIQDIFDGLAPPGGGFEGTDLSIISPSSISAEDLESLKRHNFLLWACTAGVKVDHKPFDIDSHKYLIPMYLDRSKEFVLMKSAQMGATIFVLLKIFWFCLYRAAKACFFFPTQDGVNLLSKDRLTPLVQSNMQLMEAVQDTDTIGYKKIGKESALYLRHLGGIASKDSTPFDFIAFDEVRLLPAADIDQAYERISHSTYKMVMHVSTAGYPHCFTGDTQIVVREVKTKRILPKPISELVGAHDQFEVLSYNRRGGNRPRWRRILNAICRGVNTVVKIRLWGGHTIRCTADHRFATEVEVPCGVGINWTPVSEIERYPNRYGGKVGPQNGVLALTEFPDYENSRWGESTVEAPFDVKTLGVIGSFIAEGTLYEDRELQIWQSYNGQPIRNLVKEWAELNTLPYRETEFGVFVQIKKRPDLVSLFNDCGHGAENKNIPKEVLSGSSKQLETVLYWMIEGDGHRRKERVNNHESHREWDLYTSSKILAKQVLFVGLRIGKPVSISIRDRDGAKTQYILSYNPESFRMNEILPKLGKIAIGEMEDQSIELTYDLEVEGTPWFVLAESGCLVHNSDIHRRFIQGTQNFWHSKCHCSDGVVLSDCWPDCVAVTEKDIYYRCPRCKTRINDPQNGRFIPHNPGADVSSYHIHQMMSRYISPAEVWRAWQTTQNIKEFYNAKLGKPYVDEESVPVSLDDLMACENSEINWGPSHSKYSQIAMGVDQMSGLNYVVIAERTSNKKRIIHYEIIDSLNPLYMEAGQRITPFKRLYQLMKDFDVDLCIIDAMPNANEAMDFARAFPKRVFVAWYLDSRGTQRDIVQWGDRPKERQNIKRGGPKIKFKYTCVLNRFLSIDFSLAEIGNRNCEWGHPDRLIQVARGIESGRYEPQPIMRNYFYLHMTKIIRQKTVIDNDTGKFRMEWVNLGLDPHSIHAWNFCNIALERLRRQPLMTFA